MNARGVDHQSKRRDMKIKSTFNISFQIHFVCFVLKISIVSWILLVVAFNLLTPWCSFLQKGRLMKLCDGDCTIKKRNRQQCLILKHFPGSDCQDARSYFKPSLASGASVWKRRKCCLGLLLSHYRALPCTQTCHSEYTVYLSYTGENELLRGIKCGNYITVAYTSHFHEPTDITGIASTKEASLWGTLQQRALCQPASALMFNIFPRQQGKPARHTEPPLSHRLWLNQGDSRQTKQYAPSPLLLKTLPWWCMPRYWCGRRFWQKG